MTEAPRGQNHAPRPQCAKIEEFGAEGVNRREDLTKKSGKLKNVLREALFSLVVQQGAK